VDISHIIWVAKAGKAMAVKAKRKANREVTGKASKEVTAEPSKEATGLKAWVAGQAKAMVLRPQAGRVQVLVLRPVWVVVSAGCA